MQLQSVNLNTQNQVKSACGLLKACGKRGRRGMMIASSVTSRIAAFTHLLSKGKKNDCEVRIEQVTHFYYVFYDKLILYILESTYLPGEFHVL